MSDPVAAFAWATFAWATMALFLKMFAVAMVQGVVRVRNAAFVNPDDAKFFGRGAAPRERELEIVERAQRTLRNDVENIPIALFLALAWIQLGCWPGGLAWVLGVFVVSRYCHSLFYVWPRQPWRNLSYSTGLLCCFTMCVVIVSELI